jgi:hypothetical protein
MRNYWHLIDQDPSLKLLWPETPLVSYQRRLGDYTGMHFGQAHFVTYHRFLGSARHCSVAFAEVRTGEV